MPLNLLLNPFKLILQLFNFNFVYFVFGRLLELQKLLLLLLLAHLLKELHALVLLNEVSLELFPLFFELDHLEFLSLLKLCKRVLKLLFNLRLFDFELFLDLCYFLLLRFSCGLLHLIQRVFKAVLRGGIVFSDLVF